MQTVLITRAVGFIGANFIPYLLEINKEFKIVNLDLLTYVRNLFNLTEVQSDSRYTFVKVGICDRNIFEEFFEKYKFTGAIYFAVESYVDNSTKNLDTLIKTNILGTFNLLDVAKKYLTDATNKYYKEVKNARFLHVSTDEDYGTLGETGLFIEERSYAPNTPYTPLKAPSYFLVRSYFHTYGLNVITTNYSNNYGAKQHDEKLIPTIIRKAISEENIPIYGDGKNIRDWLYVFRSVFDATKLENELGWKAGRNLSNFPTIL